MNVWKEQKGFTLVELMMVVLVLGMLLGGMVNTFKAQQQAYVIQQELAQMNQVARMAMEIIGRDIQNAASDPLGTSGATILVATSTSILFSQDIRNASDCMDTSLSADGQLNCPGEWLGYRFDSNHDRIDQYFDNTNSCADCWEPFVQNIQNLRFRYIYADGGNSDDEGGPDPYSDGDDTNDLDDIREIEIQVQTQSGNAVAAAFQRILTSRVQVRNLALK